MQIDLQKRFGLATALVTATLSLARPSMGQTSTAPAGDTSTPSAFMLTYDGLAGADPKAYLPFFSASDEADLKLARAEAKFDAEVGMLQKIVLLRWGNDAVTMTIHALGMQTADDIRTAKVTETGDHATVLYADGTSGPILVKTAAGWRLDTPAFRKALGMPVGDYVKELHQLSAIIADIAESVDQRRLRSIDAVSHEIAQRTSTLTK